MVNEVAQQLLPHPLSLVYGDLSERYDLFVADRSRILIATVAPNHTVGTVCHIHASKQITVLYGYAEIELSDKSIALFEGQSAHVPNGTAHRIVNLGKIPLKYVEIRTGPYVKDDDRFG